MKRKQPQTSDPVDLAAAALRHRDRSRLQVDERLARAGVEDGRRADALDALERIGYVATPASPGSALRRSPTEATATRRSGRCWRPTASRRRSSARRSGRFGRRSSARRRSSRPRRLAADGGPARPKGFGEQSVEAAAGEFAADGPRRRVPNPDDASLNPETVVFLQSSVSPIESTVPVSHDFSHRAPRQTETRPNEYLT